MNIVPADTNIITLPDDALPTVDELSGDLQLLAQIIGVGKALEVAQVFRGTPIRIYGIDKWLRRHRDRIIRTEYSNNILSAVELARKYRLSERQIWNILGTAEPDERQFGLF